MSFELTYGDKSTANIEGLTVWMKSWPSPSIANDLVDTIDGSRYAGTSLRPLKIGFDCEITTTTPQATLAARDKLLGILHHGHGLRKLYPELAGGWYWNAVISDVGDFERGLWIKGYQCTLNGSFAFTAPEGAMRPDAPTVAGAGTITPKGNSVCYPTVRVTGYSGNFSIQVGVTKVDISNAFPRALPAGTLVLDYENLDFAVWSGDTKLRNVAANLSTTTRAWLPPGVPSTVSTTSGSISVTANDRRI